MTTRLPQARLIQGHPTQNVLHVVYDYGVQLAEVRPVVRHMSALDHIQARALMGSMGDPRGPKSVVVQIAIRQGANLPEAMRLLKLLTRPRLPVAIRLIQVGLLICHCKCLSPTLGALEFYVGLGPDDMDAFRRGYVVGMTQLPVARLFSEEPQPPYRLLTEGIEAVLAGIGARATMIEVLPRRDTRPCTHPA